MAVDVIYIQFLPECEVDMRAQVRLSDMARMTPRDAELESLEFDIPCAGRRVDAVEVAARISRLRPGARMELLGGGEVFVSRRDHRRGLLAWALKAGLTLLLFGGAALGMTFFHADVNMLEAQSAICAMFGGGDAEPLALAIPYSLGVLAGVGGFFLLGGRRKSPLALKLQSYRKQLEQADEMGRR